MVPMVTAHSLEEGEYGVEERFGLVSSVVGNDGRLGLGAL